MYIVCVCVCERERERDSLGVGMEREPGVEANEQSYAHGSTKAVFGCQERRGKQGQVWEVLCNLPQEDTGNEFINI